MNLAPQNTTQPRGHLSRSRSCLAVRVLLACQFLFLFAALGFPAASHAADTYGTLLDKQFDPRAITKTNPPTDNSSGTAAANIAAFEQALKNRAAKIEVGPPPP